MQNGKDEDMLIILLFLNTKNISITFNFLVLLHDQVCAAQNIKSAKSACKQNACKFQLIVHTQITECHFNQRKLPNVLFRVRVFFGEISDRSNRNRL